MPDCISARPQRIAERIWDGALYPGPGRTDKAVIVMSGSEGGTEHTGKCAHFLQGSDVPVLALTFAALFYFLEK